MHQGVWNQQQQYGDCVWGPSIVVINTESVSPRPALVLHSVSTEHSEPVVQQLDWRCCDGDKSLWAQQSLFPCCFFPILSFSFSCNSSLARSYHEAACIHPKQDFLSSYDDSIFCHISAVKTVKWQFKKTSMYLHLEEVLASASLCAAVAIAHGAIINIISYDQFIPMSSWDHRKIYGNFLSLENSMNLDCLII